MDAVTRQAKPRPEMLQAGGLFESPEGRPLVRWQTGTAQPQSYLYAVRYLDTTSSRWRWISAISSSLNGG